MQVDSPIVITGIGPLCSIGSGKSQLWESIKREKTHVVLRNFFEDNESLGSFYHHKIDNFSISDFDLDADILEWIHEWKQGVEDIDLMYLAAVSKLALDDSKLRYDYVKNDIGLVVTHENPGLEAFFNRSLKSAYSCMVKRRNSTKSVLMREVYDNCERQGYDTQTFMYLFFLSKLFSIHGFSLFVNNACASGLYAIETASQLIRSKKCSAVLVAGADSQSMVYKHWWLKSLGLYAEDGLIKPYAASRNGFVLGEGGAALVLESRAMAEERGANIYAEYLGGGFNLEAGRVSLPTVEIDYYSDCIQEALRSARVSASDIDLINSHGIGTKITDAHEARSIQRVFNGADNYVVSTSKPYFGHNLGSCALLEVSLLILMLTNNYVPKSLNAIPHDSKLKIPIVEQSHTRNLKTVLKLSCGFAGYNAAAVFRRVQ